MAEKLKAIQPPTSVFQSSQFQVEPKYQEAYDVWRADPTETTNHQLLQALDPDIDKAIRTHAGTSNPLLRSRARRIVLDSMPRYDPGRAQIGTHIFNQLKGLKRYQGQQRNVLRVPERIVLDRNYLGGLQQELEDDLGREPTDEELSDRSGFSMKRLARIRQYQPGVNTGLLQSLSEMSGNADNSSPAVNQRDNDIWLQIVYDDLPAIDKKIFEYTLGYNGKQVLSNQEIAAKLGRSPGAISQRKLLIQRMLDQEAGLSPF